MKDALRVDLRANVEALPVQVLGPRSRRGGESEAEEGGRDRDSFREHAVILSGNGGQ